MNSSGRWIRLRTFFIASKSGAAGVNTSRRSSAFDRSSTVAPSPPNPDFALPRNSAQSQFLILNIHKHAPDDFFLDTRQFLRHLAPA